MSGGTRLQERIAEEVRVLLARRNRSASWLAREAGVTQTWMSSRLTGRTPMTVDDLERLAQVLDVSVVDLLGWLDEGSSKRRSTAGVPGVSDPIVPHQQDPRLDQLQVA